MKWVFILKKNVAIIFGGNSSEHDVSVVSATSVIKNVPKDKYDIVMLGITKDGRWLKFDGDVEKLSDDSWADDESCVSAFISPDASVHGIVVMNDPVQTIHIDAAFPVLHGKNGEDGTIQGLFQLAGIPFVGCDTISSGACMDKSITNALADMAHVAQANWVSFNKFDFSIEEDKCFESIEKLGYPIFVKPACAGSSVGITKAHNREELLKGIKVAFNEDDKIVFEETVDGFEVECAVLGNENPIAGEVGQIVSCKDFYDYEAKYVNPETELFIPAKIADKKRAEVAESAKKIYKTLGCEGLSRVDFFVSKDDGKVLFNEINTIPGFTSISMYPKLMGAVGIGYDELIDRLFQLAIARNGE